MTLLMMPTKEIFMTRGERVVAAAFEDLFDELGMCPRNREIAKRTGLSDATVSDAMRRMVKLGFYRRVKGRHAGYFIRKRVPRPKTSAA